MSRASPAERAAAVEGLAHQWAVLPREFGAWASTAPESSASRLGRFESYHWLAEWPDRVASQAAREVERAERAAPNGDNGRQPVAAPRR